MLGTGLTIIATIIITVWVFKSIVNFIDNRPVPETDEEKARRERLIYLRDKYTKNSRWLFFQGDNSEDIVVRVKNYHAGGNWYTCYIHWLDKNNGYQKATIEAAIEGVLTPIPEKSGI